MIYNDKTKVCLTKTVRASGWAAKLSPGDLENIIRNFKLKKDDNLLFGLENSEDASVYKISEDIAIVQSVDFFTPIVDSPYNFGAISAANSLSDIYAMGAKPLTAMNIVCFPINEISPEILKETLQGGLDKIHEAGAILVGGHSVDDKEFKYGLSITGIVHPDKAISNAGLNVKDKLILTKPLGTGIIATAIKGAIASQKAIDKLIVSASTLNKKASEIMLKYSPSSCTDITGFGFAGHALEMVKASKVEILIFADKLPYIDEAYEYASMGLIPAGSYENKKFCINNMTISKNLNQFSQDIIFDPQTSGGLLIGIKPENCDKCLKELINNGINAHIIGEVTENNNNGHLSII